MRIRQLEYDVEVGTQESLHRHTERHGFSGCGRASGQRFRSLEEHVQVFPNQMLILINQGNLKDIEKLLNDPSIDINFQDSHGRSYLLVLTSSVDEHSELPTLNFLLEKGLNPDLKDSEGDTPLHHAMKLGNLEMAKALIHKACQLNLVNAQGILPLKITIPDHVEARLQDDFRILIKSKPTDPTPYLFGKKSGILECADTKARYSRVRNYRARQNGTARLLWPVACTR